MAASSLGALAVAICVASLVVPAAIFLSFEHLESGGDSAADRPAGFMHLHHAGLVGKLQPVTFSSSASQTRSQNGHQAFVSRYSVTPSPAASSECGIAVALAGCGALEGTCPLRRV